MASLLTCLALTILSASRLASATEISEIRVIMPAFASQDPFVTSLREALATNSIRLIPKVVSNPADVLRAALEGAEQAALFPFESFYTIKDLKEWPSLATLLTQPFQFASLQELFDVEDTPFGSAVLADVSRTGLVPLVLWNRGQSKLISRSKISSKILSA